ncbi:hypothetical protein RJT34_01005 [Clitoria ternatea]|uniref:Uncharacterized protein n=1 Tax=Clitoria ternatea TaxID=43366 RepID=A0AAN9KJ32_CLITE
MVSALAVSCFCSPITSLSLHYSPPSSVSKLQFTTKHLLHSFCLRCSNTNTLPTLNANFSYLLITHSRIFSNTLFTHSLVFFFQFSASLISLFQEFGIGFVETQVLVSNNPDLTSVSMHSLRSRVLSLQSLGFDRVSLHHLVAKRPTVLTDNEIDPFLTFLKDELQGKFEIEQLNRLLSATEPKFLVDFPHKVQLLVHRGVPVDEVVHVLNKLNLPKALCHRSIDEIDRTIAFLERFGGVSLILKRPVILNYDLDNQLVPRISVLIELSGGDEDGIGRLLLRFPAFLNYSVEHVEGHVEFLRSFAELDEHEIFRVMLGFPAIVTTSRNRKLRPRVQFLKECGLDSDDIFKFLIKAPLFLSHSFHGNIANKLVLLVKIGFRYRTKDLAMAIRSATRTNCENLQKVIGLFLSYGFSFEEIVAMSKKHPQILQYNHASLEKKMKYLIEEMNRDIAELLVFPAFLGYKLDDRIKLRYEVKKRMREGKMSINKLLTVSNERFVGEPTKACAMADLE